MVLNRRHSRECCVTPDTRPSCNYISIVLHWRDQQDRSGRASEPWVRSDGRTAGEGGPSAAWLQSVASQKGGRTGRCPAGEGGRGGGTSAAWLHSVPRHHYLRAVQSL